MAELSSPARVKEILQRYQFRTKKSLGQNFLTDRNIIYKIVEGAQVAPTDCVVEIGPGIGVMTTVLAEKAQRVLAVEIDKNLLPILAETLSNHSNTEVVEADALKVDFDQLVTEKTGSAFGIEAASYKLVANLPYYITTPLIMHMLTNKFHFHSLVVMVQKEVAQRMAASPGGKDYGSLSVAVQYYTKVELLFKVPNTVFFPAPEVDSAVIKLTVRSKPAVEVMDEAVFFQVVRNSFGQRRKTILNALSNTFGCLTKEEWLQALNKVQIDPKRRGETLSLEEFAALADEVKRRIK